MSMLGDPSLQSGDHSAMQANQFARNRLMEQRDIRDQDSVDSSEGDIEHGSHVRRQLKHVRP